MYSSSLLLFIFFTIVIPCDACVIDNFLADRSIPRKTVGEVGLDAVPKAAAHEGEKGQNVDVRDSVFGPHSVSFRPGLFQESFQLFQDPVRAHLIGGGCLDF